MFFLRKSGAVMVEVTHGTISELKLLPFALILQYTLIKTQIGVKLFIFAFHSKLPPENLSYNSIQAIVYVLRMHVFIIMEVG